MDYNGTYIGCEGILRVRGGIRMVKGRMAKVRNGEAGARGRALGAVLAAAVLAAGCGGSAGGGQYGGPAGSAPPSAAPSAAAPAPAQTPGAAGTARPAVSDPAAEPQSAAAPALAQLKLRLAAETGGRTPAQWGERTAGVKTRLDTREQVVALTFDACGGDTGSGYDDKLIAYLNEQRIPATLFVNKRWSDANPDAFRELASNPLFEIENHGTEHKPLSVIGKSAYGIKGTSAIGEAVDEVSVNADNLERLTRRKPKFFRSGTAYYDEIAVQAVNALGETPVNFSVLGDAGATYNSEQVKKALLGAAPGSIVIGHMNHPEKDTAEGVIAAVPELVKKGYRFVKLEDYPLK
jgi:peptidoglycan/xylan/chitin deacetylase (PgdA/CDA1 family)